MKSTNGSIISSNITNERRSSLSTKHRRQSSVNAVSWNDTVSIKCSTPNKPTQKPEELHVTMRKKLLHRRHQSVGNAKYSLEDSVQKLQDTNRRLSNLSWAQEETLRRYSKRPNSWGPVGTDIYATDTSMLYANACCDLRLHGQCIFHFYLKDTQIFLKNFLNNFFNIIVKKNFNKITFFLRINNTFFLIYNVNNTNWPLIYFSQLMKFLKFFSQ